MFPRECTAAFREIQQQLPLHVRLRWFLPRVGHAHLSELVNPRFAPSLNMDLMLGNEADGDLLPSCSRRRRKPMFGRPDLVLLDQAVTNRAEDFRGQAQRGQRSGTIRADFFHERYRQAAPSLERIEQTVAKKRARWRQENQWPRSVQCRGQSGQSGKRLRRSPIGSQEYDRKAGAAGDEVLAEAVKTMSQVGGRRAINLEDPDERSAQPCPIDLKNDEVFEVEVERIAALRPIPAHGDDAAVVVTDDLARATVTTWARAPDLLDDPAGRSQIRGGNRPFVLKDSLPFQALDRRTGYCLEGRPPLLQYPHPARSPGR